jgi:hypothetical protein
VKSDEERGTVGVWLKRMREKAGYASQRLLLKALADRGILVHSSVYAALEARGKADTPMLRALVDRLATFYGVQPPDLSPRGLGNGPELVAALTAQTASIEALVNELRLARAEQAHWNQDIHDVVTSLGKIRLGGDGHRETALTE